MWRYLYFVFVFIILSYDIIRDIYFFNKSQYNPYPFRKREKETPFVIRFVINLIILIGALKLLTSTHYLYIMIYIFLIYSFCRVICTSVLNYLSYLKIKDPKIIFHTVIFNIIIISITIGIWYITK